MQSGQHAMVEEAERKHRLVGIHYGNGGKPHTQPAWPMRDKSGLSALMRLAKRSNQIVRPDSCIGCGVRTKLLLAHHPDYERPLHVVWFCRRCHKVLHVELMKESAAKSD